MPTITYDNTARTVPAHRVYLKAQWQNAWGNPVEGLFCDSCSFVAGPAINSAQISFRYGRILQPGSSDYVTVARLDILRWLVKIEIDNPEGGNPVVWIGTVEEEQPELGGTIRRVGPELVAIPTGRQNFTCYGLDFLLERQPILESVCEAPEGGSYRVARAIDFNREDQQAAVGNRSLSQANSPEDSYIFAASTEPGQSAAWRAPDILQYLIANHAPRGLLGQFVPWSIGGGPFAGAIPSWDTSRRVAQGRTVKQLVDEILNPNRMIGYHVTTTDAGASLVAFSYLDDPLEFQDHTLPANDRQFDVLVQDCAGCQASLLRSTSSLGDQVICRGARIVSCFSITNEHETLDRFWSDGEQDDYSAGATSDGDGLPNADYEAADVYVKQRLNNDARKRDGVSHVFAHFGLPADWDGKAGIYPYLADVNTWMYIPPFYRPDLRFLTHLPLKTFHDYTQRTDDENNPQLNPINNTPSGQAWEYLPMLAWIGTEEIDDQTSKTRYVRLDRAGVSAEVENYEAHVDRQWSAHLRPLQDAPGFCAHVTGAHQQVLAKDDFSPTNVDDPAGPYDWKTIVATVAIQTDYFCDGSWPESNVDLPFNTDAIRRTVLDFGDRYQAHYVVKNTAYDIDHNAQLVRVADSGFIRDDRPKLQALARLAWDYYATVRSAIMLRFNFFTAQLAVGDLIRALDAREVRSVVVGVHYQFQESGPETTPIATTTIQTQFADLNLADFADFTDRATRRFF